MKMVLTMAGLVDRAPIHFVFLFIIGLLLMIICYNHYDILSIVRLKPFSLSNFLSHSLSFYSAKIKAQKFQEFLVQNKNTPRFFYLLLQSSVCVHRFLRWIENNQQQQQLTTERGREPETSHYDTHKNIGLLSTQVPDLISSKCFFSFILSCVEILLFSSCDFVNFVKPKIKNHFNQ